MEYVKFITPTGGAVLAVKDGNTYRAAQGNEVTQIAMGNVPVQTIKSTTSTPLTEFNKAPSVTPTPAGITPAQVAEKEALLKQIATGGGETATKVGAIMAPTVTQPVTSAPPTTSFGANSPDQTALLEAAKKKAAENARLVTEAQGATEGGGAPTAPVEGTAPATTAPPFERKETPPPVSFQTLPEGIFQGIDASKLPQYSEDPSLMSNFAIALNTAVQQSTLKRRQAEQTFLGTKIPGGAVPGTSLAEIFHNLDVAQMNFLKPIGQALMAGAEREQELKYEQFKFERGLTVDEAQAKRAFIINEAINARNHNMSEAEFARNFNISEDDAERAYKLGEFEWQRNQQVEAYKEAEAKKYREYEYQRDLYTKKQSDISSMSADMAQLGASAELVSAVTKLRESGNYDAALSIYNQFVATKYKGEWESRTLDDGSVERVNLETGEKVAVFGADPTMKETGDYKIGALRSYESGGETVTEEWNGTVWMPKAKSGGNKIGDTREYISGTQTIKEEWDGTKWVRLGAGPRWEPNQPSSVDERDRQNNLVALIADIPTHKNREDALADAELNKTAIILQVGQTGYETYLAEIDRIFPPAVIAKTATTGTSTTKPSSGIMSGGEEVPTTGTQPSNIYVPPEIWDDEATKKYYDQIGSSLFGNTYGY